MNILKAYSKAFGKYKIPKVLKKLAQFDARCGNEYYADEFYLDADDDLRWYSDTKDEAYYDRLFRFAHADGTGASYAFWLPPEEENLKNAPIIYFGSEGNITLIAKNLKGLIRLLSFGPECMDGSFYKDTDDYEMPNKAREFRKWMKNVLGIKPIKDVDVDSSYEVDALIEKAQKKYKKAFDAWQYQFYPDPEVERREYEAKENARLALEEAEVLKVLETSPDDANLYYKLGIIEQQKYGEEDRWQRVNGFFEKALKLDPEHLESCEILAERLEFHDEKRAIELYIKIENSRNNHELYRTIANLCMDVEDIEKAMHYYTLAIEKTDKRYLYNDLDDAAKSHPKALLSMCKALEERGVKDRLITTFIERLT